MTDAYQHYVDHKEEYEEISEQLDTVRETFKEADSLTQHAMLFDSTVFAVMSVQNSVEILERCFEGYCRADSWSEVRGVFRGLNYGNNKYEYVNHNVGSVMEGGDEIIEALCEDRVWDAVELIVEKVKGVSWIKASFVPAMLGFKSVICIDTNVAQMVGENMEASGYTTRAEYNGAVGAVMSRFPQLNDELEPFMVQWVLFDANRGGVERHPAWFNHVLPGSPFGRQVALDEY